MTDRELGLADAIDAVRRELIDAQSRGKGSEIRFRVGTVQLEFQVEISTSFSGEGGIQVWVLTAKGGGERTSASTQTVRVELSPITADGEDVMVSQRRRSESQQPPLDERPLGGYIQ